MVGNRGSQWPGTNHNPGLSRFKPHLGKAMRCSFPWLPFPRRRVIRRWTLLLVTASCLAGAQRSPMVVDDQHSASYRWLHKTVLESRPLDNMESLDKWTPFTHGAPAIVDARVSIQAAAAPKVVAEMTLTSERSRDGGHSIRFRTPTRLDGPGPVNGRGWGTAGVVRHFDGEDWQKFNRVSLWIYPDCPGLYTVALGMRLHNDGVVKLPAAFGQEGENSVVLRNGEWNHVVWEIGNVARDKITELEISYGLSGNAPEEPDTVSFDFDQLALERVEPDYIEGWKVWPGRIAYSQTGYLAGAEKSAIANGLNAREFRLINTGTGKVVLRKPIDTVTGHLGPYQVMDFTEVRQSGSYRLEAGEASTQPFRIDADVWTGTIWKALNFFYSERCGYAVPGVHGVCHRDWQAVHDGKRIIVNGGWHDAGDLTQGLGNTAEAEYAMFSLAEWLHARGEDPELQARLIEEGRWGLSWILKTSFGDGYRDTGSVSSRRTNGIIGDFDDVIAEAHNTPLNNFTASASEAIAARVLKESDPRLAAYSLKMAKADWQFAVAGMADPKLQQATDLWHVTFDSDDVKHEVASAGVLASVDIWKLTGEQQYQDKAIELARIILDSQQRTRPDWAIPFLGFFYTGPEKDRILHYCHRGREQGPIVALTHLCDAFPNHPDWMKWYAAAELHSEYLKAMASYTQPYGMMPASIYKDTEYLQVPESRRESFRKQVLNGIAVGDGHYLRLFAVWMDYRGHFGTILPQALALGEAAHLRGDLKAAELAQDQMEWVVGRNPFAQSMMWGEGYDYAPQDTPSSGNMVGSLPVGIQTRGDADEPYWPVQNTWTYKEVWVHPVASWLALMPDLGGPALVQGTAKSAISFSAIPHGNPMEVHPDPATGRFRVMLPQGQYAVLCNAERETRTFLPGETYDLDLRPGRALDFEVSKKAVPDGEVTISVTARGSGAHSFALRADNLTLDGARKQITLQPGAAGHVEWHARIDSSKTPWVAVVVPDEVLARRKEVSGAIWDTQKN
jgi:Glycosyl hydrolase family 9/Cellulase N-terminal ig-like domain